VKVGVDVGIAQPLRAFLVAVVKRTNNISRPQLRVQHNETTGHSGGARPSGPGYVLY
jgi:hypothetical protein